MWDLRSGPGLWGQKRKHGYIASHYLFVSVLRKKFLNSLIVRLSFCLLGRSFISVSIIIRLSFCYLEIVRISLLVDIRLCTPDISFQTSIIVKDSCTAILLFSIFDFSFSTNYYFEKTNFIYSRKLILTVQKIA